MDEFGGGGLAIYMSQPPAAAVPTVTASLVHQLNVDPWLRTYMKYQKGTLLQIRRNVAMRELVASLPSPDSMLLQRSRHPT